MSAFGQQSVKMDDILDVARQEGHLRSPEVVFSAEKILLGASTQEEISSAKMLLAQSLADTGSHSLNAADLEKARAIWKDELRDRPSSWEGQLSRFNLITDLGAQGSNSALIVSAQDALQDMDFDVLETNTSPVLKTFREINGERPNLFREGMKLALANALCNELRIEEAREILDTISDPEYKNIAQARIALAEKARQERKRLAAKPQQPEKN